MVIHGEMPLIDWPPPGYTADELVMTGLVDAGLVSTLTSHYFSSYNDILMDNLTDQMRDLEVPRYCTAQEMGDLFTTHLCIGK